MGVEKRFRAEVAQLGGLAKKSPGQAESPGWGEGSKMLHSGIEGPNRILP